jgi:hypothetical protein
MRIESDRAVLNAFWYKTLSLIAVAAVLAAGIITAMTQSPRSFRQEPPDLTLASSDITFSNDQPIQYETITIYATIHNIGSGSALNITVRFYDIYENFTYIIDETIIDEIGANSSEQTQIDWRVGSPGVHEIKVCADPDNKIAESDEGNNCASRDLVEQRLYISCKDNAHTVPIGESREYTITIKDNVWCRCIHNISLRINMPIFFSEWNPKLSLGYFDSIGGQATNVTLTVEVPETTQGKPSVGLTAPICVEATMRLGHESYNETHSVCTYTTAGEGVEQINATVDIDPDTLNLKSKGKWITAYIELPSNYNVSDIYVSTVRLEDNISAEEHPTEIGDQDKDGIPDLMVKFDRLEVQKMLLIPGKYTLKISGELIAGTEFEGRDTIRVINP